MPSLGIEEGQVVFNPFFLNKYILANRTVCVVFARMIQRETRAEVMRLMEEFPAVAILGPRQVGKTTLALNISASVSPKPIYLDLENPSDKAKLNEPEIYLEMHKGKLIVLDEIQRLPELFQVLRGVIDRRRHEGYKSGQFLILGSASLDLLKQSSESLAGRIAYKKLPGLTAYEIDKKNDFGFDSL